MSRKRLNWLYNEDRQEFATPAGIVSLHDVAAILADYAQCREPLVPRQPLRQRAHLQLIYSR